MERTQHLLARVQVLAETVAADLRPFCHDVAIAGVDQGGADLRIRPKLCRDVFGEPTSGDQATEELSRWCLRGRFDMRAPGTRFLRFRDRETGLFVNLTVDDAR